MNSMEGPIETQYQSGILVKGMPDFVDKTVAHLNSIAETTVGKRLLQSLSASGKVVTIVPGSGRNEAQPVDCRAATAKGKVLRWKELYGKEKSIKGSGAGSDTLIRYNPDEHRFGSGEAWRQAPHGIWLAHELIHADDAAYGRMDPEKVDGLHNFERQAIGLPPYKQKAFTENRFRAEWMPPQPRRTGY